MTRPGEKLRFMLISVWFQDCLFFFGCFFYLLFRTHPILTLEVHSPIFFKGISFFGDFLKIPGGVIDWLSALFMQFWFTDLICSLFLAFCFWMVAFLTKKWIETLTEYRPIHTFHMIPAILLFAFYIINYDFGLNVALAIIINLLILVLLLHWLPKQPAVRLGASIIIAGLLYWITGGAFLIFSVLFGLHELFFRKHIANGLLLLMIALILPYAAFVSVFLVAFKQAYLKNFILENLLGPWYIAAAFLAFYLLVLIGAFLRKFDTTQKFVRRITRFFVLRKLAYFGKWSIGTIFLCVSAVLLVQETQNTNVWQVLEVSKSLRERRWHDALKTIAQCPFVNPLLSYQTNFALFQSDLLLDRMFAYPQVYGIDGLVMDGELCARWPQKASDMYWQLGLVNESLHWAHEALELVGPTPEILKRLGMVYMVKGDHIVAKRFFLNLKNVPFQEKTAVDLLRVNENPAELSQDSEVVYIQSRIPAEDMISLGNLSTGHLGRLLKQNPKNKMAFEYLLAYYLLTGNLKGIVDNFSRFQFFSYTHIPQHIQEALLIVASQNPRVDQNQLKKYIQSQVYERFVKYEQIFHSHQDNTSSARQELQMQFSDTYWYYLMYIRSASQQSESQREFQ
jgi:hypothetical protein